MNTTKKVTWLATGVATLAANTLNPMLISPAAAAAPSLPTCDATQSDEVANAAIATYNTAAINNYKGGAKYKQLAAAVKNAQKALKGKKGKAKVAAEKNLTKAIAKRDAALAAATTAATVTQFKATVTGEVVDVDRTWGDYSTRIFVKAGKVVDLCYNIDESMVSEGDREISLNDYISLWPLDDLTSELVPGNSAKSATQINEKFAEYINGYWFDLTAESYDWNSQLGAMSGATYTIKTFYSSIQAALLEADLVS